jgi:2-keto-4-pentenoate hydratase
LMTTELTQSRAIQDIAGALRNAHERRVPITPVREQLGNNNVAAAYAVQETNTAHWLGAGRRLIGRKIGLTSPAVQRQLGVDQPDYGVLYADMALADGEQISRQRLIQPKVEAEIAFALKKALDGQGLHLAEVIAAIEYALPALEIVDSRIANWDIGIVDTIADNASCGLFVLGATPKKISEFDLRLCGMVVEKNGEPVSFGAGAACLGNPLNALLWLARKMVETGRPLEGGELVLSGALGPMVAMEKGDFIEARVSGLGSARLVVTA